VTAAPPARRHHQTYPDPICQSAASRRRACGAARRRQPDRPLRPPAGTTKPILTRSARAPPLVAARAARRGVANRIEVVPCWDPNGTATGSGSHRHAVADRWASLPGDLVRLVASRVLAGDLLDYAASGRLHRLAVRGREPRRPSPTVGRRCLEIWSASVADRWASRPGDLVRLVASRVLADDLLDYAASGRLHRLAVRGREPRRPSPTVGRRCLEIWSASSRRVCWPATC
jgi:hypothetical protein